MDLTQLVSEWLINLWRAATKGWVKIVLLVVLIPCLIWLSWNHIAELPGIPQLIRIVQDLGPIPSPDNTKLSIAIARIDGDDADNVQKDILSDLDLPSIYVTAIPRSINSNNLQIGRRQAQHVLDSSGFDVLLWGRILRAGPKIVPQLFWTTNNHRDMNTGLWSTRIVFNDEMQLPPVFLHDLDTILGLVLSSQANQLIAVSDRRYTADNVKVFIRRTQALISDESLKQDLSPLMQAMLSSSLASALLDLAGQSGDRHSLYEAVHYEHLALAKWPRRAYSEHAPTSQANLGTAFAMLGEAESNPTYLRLSVAAFSQALRRWPYGTHRLEWAAMHGNIAASLSRLGDLTKRREYFEQSIAVSRSELQGITWREMPIEWARAENNLGKAYEGLGEQEASPTHLRMAVEADRAALTEFTRDDAPFRWAEAEIDLGVALQGLSNHEVSTRDLELALAADRAALEAFDRARTPTKWATAEVDLADSLLLLGIEQSSVTHLEEAVDAFRNALEVWTADSHPIEHLKVQEDIGVAFDWIGEIESDPHYLSAATAMFENLLLEKRSQVPFDFEEVEYNLGNSYELLGVHEASMSHLEQAVGIYRKLLGRRSTSESKQLIGGISFHLGVALEQIGLRTWDLSTLRQAVNAYRDAQHVLTCANYPEDCSKIQVRLDFVREVIALYPYFEREPQEDKSLRSR